MGVSAATVTRVVQWSASPLVAVAGSIVRANGAIIWGVPLRLAPRIVHSVATPLCAPDGLIPLTCGGSAQAPAASGNPVATTSAASERLMETSPATLPPGAPG